MQFFGDYSLPGYDAVLIYNLLLTFRTSLLLQPSGQLKKFKLLGEMFALLISNGTAGLAKGLDYHTTPLTPLTNYEYHLTHSLPILYTEAKLFNCLFFLDYSEDGNN